MIDEDTEVAYTFGKRKRLVIEETRWTYSVAKSKKGATDGFGIINFYSFEVVKMILYVRRKLGRDSGCLSV